MNPDIYKSQSSLRGKNRKFLQRFNPKLNISLFDLQNEKIDIYMKTIP